MSLVLPQTQPHAPPSVTRCEEGGCDQAGTIDIPILINNQETGKGKLVCVKHFKKSLVESVQI